MAYTTSQVQWPTSVNMALVTKKFVQDVLTTLDDSSDTAGYRLAYDLCTENAAITFSTGLYKGKDGEYTVDIQGADLTTCRDPPFETSGS